MATQPTGPRPNDFHFEQGVLKPGLGADEPSEKQRVEMELRMAADREREEAFERAQTQLEEEAAVLQAKESDLAAREAALAAREAALAGR